MKEVEVHLVTRRQISPRLIEMFNWQTCKDFTLKILTRYPQPWRVEDLDVDFPIELNPTKLAYSSGTRYAMCLANNELLCSTTSKYVLRIEDFMVMSPLTVESFLLHAEEDLCIAGFVRFIHVAWEEYGVNYESFEHDMDESHRTTGLDTFQESNMPGGRLLAYGGVQEFNMLGGLLFFPLAVYKRINGWDLGLDGGWGGADFNLGHRIMMAGYRFAKLSGAAAYHFEHVAHYEEQADPHIPDSLCVYNKETGVRMNWIGRRGAGYMREVIEKRIIRAPQGMEEVCGLL